MHTAPRRSESSGRGPPRRTPENRDHNRRTPSACPPHPCTQTPTKSRTTRPPARINGTFVLSSHAHAVRFAAQTCLRARETAQCASRARQCEKRTPLCARGTRLRAGKTVLRIRQTACCKEQTTQYATCAVRHCEETPLRAGRRATRMKQTPHRFGLHGHSYGQAAVYVARGKHIDNRREMVRKPRKRSGRAL